MEIVDFIYHRPSSIQQACSLLAELRPNALVLGGGTEVLVDLKQRAYATRHLISLRDIPSLREITVDDDGLHIGAQATQENVHRSEIIRRHYPALSEAAGSMAAVQVRNRGTVSGNFCSAVPSADLPPICIAGSAKIRLARLGGERVVPAESFFVAPRQTARVPDEVLLEVRIPGTAWAPGTGAKYHKFGLRGASALAVAGVAAWLRIEAGRVTECRIVLGAVHATALLASDASGTVIGEEPSEGLFDRAGEVASKECSPISDLRGSAGYRRELVRVLTARALRDACGRAGVSVE